MGTKFIPDNFSRQGEPTQGEHGRVLLNLGSCNLWPNKKTEPRRKDSGNDRNVKWEGASRHLPQLPSCGSTRHIQTPSGGYCHLISLGRQLEGKFNDPYKKQRILQDVEGREKKNVSKGEEDLKTMENQASVLNQNLKKMHIRS